MDAKHQLPAGFTHDGAQQVRQLGDVDVVHTLYGIVKHDNAMPGPLDKVKRQKEA